MKQTEQLKLIAERLKIQFVGDRKPVPESVPFEVPTPAEIEALAKIVKSKKLSR